MNIWQWDVEVFLEWYEEPDLSLKNKQTKNSPL